MRAYKNVRFSLTNLQNVCILIKILEKGKKVV